MTTMMTRTTMTRTTMTTMKTTTTTTIPWFLFLQNRRQHPSPSPSPTPILSFPQTRDTLVLPPLLLRRWAWPFVVDEEKEEDYENEKEEDPLFLSLARSPKLPRAIDKGAFSNAIQSRIGPSSPSTRTMMTKRLRRHKGSGTAGKFQPPGRTKIFEIKT